MLAARGDARRPMWMLIPEAYAASKATADPQRLDPTTAGAASPCAQACRLIRENPPVRLKMEKTTAGDLDPRH